VRAGRPAVRQVPGDGDGRDHDRRDGQDQATAPAAWPAILALADYVVHRTAAHSVPVQDDTW
jgi:hypothetical protein